MKKQKNSASVASRSAKKVHPFRKAIINVCGEPHTGKTSGIAEAARYFAERWPMPKMTALQKLVYKHLSSTYHKECFEVLLINGRRVGFFSKGDDTDHIAMTHILISIFKCDIAVVASRRDTPIHRYIKETADFHGMEYFEIPTKCKKLPYDTTIAGQIIAQVNELAEVNF